MGWLRVVIGSFDFHVTDLSNDFLVPRRLMLIAPLFCINGYLVLVYIQPPVIAFLAF